MTVFDSSWKEEIYDLVADEHEPRLLFPNRTIREEADPNYPGATCLYIDDRLVAQDIRHFVKGVKEAGQLHLAQRVLYDRQVVLQDVVSLRVVEPGSRWSFHVTMSHTDPQADNAISKRFSAPKTYLQLNGRKGKVRRW